jgi:signal transduction histidine kinase
MEEERQRIGRDLHDGHGQKLTGTAYLCRTLEEQLHRQKISLPLN